MWDDRSLLAQNPAVMSQNIAGRGSTSPPPEFAEDSELESRIASNIERQQANFERQDRMLEEIEREVGMQFSRPEPPTSTGYRSTSRHDTSVLSPVPTGTEVYSGRRGGGQPKLSELLSSNQLDGPASLASAQRQAHLWKHEVETQRRVIVELRDKIAELQRVNMSNEQSQLKVTSLERRLSYKDEELSRIRAEYQTLSLQLTEAQRALLQATSDNTELASDSERQMEQLTTRLTAANETITNQTIHINELEKQCEGVQGQLTQHIAMCESLRQQLAEVSEENESITKQLSEQQHLDEFHSEERSSLERENIVLKRELMALRDKAAKVDKLQAEVEEYKQQVTSTTEITTMNIRLRTELASLQGVLSAERAQREAVEDTKANQIKLNQDMQQSLTDMSKKLVHHEALKQELQACKHQIDRLSTQVGQLQANEVQMSGELKELTATVKGFEAEDELISELITNEITATLINDPSTPIAAKSRRNVFSELRYNRAVPQAIHNAVGRATTFLSDNQRQRELLESASYEIDSLKQEVTSLQAALRDANDRLANGDKGYAQLEQSHSQSQSDVRELQQQLSACMEVLRDWEQSLSDAPKVTHSPPQSSRRVLTSSTTGVSVVPRLIALKDLFQQRSAQCTSVCSQAQELERQVTQLNTKLQLLEGKHEQALRKKESEHAQHIKDATAQAVQQASMLHSQADELTAANRELHESYTAAVKELESCRDQCVSLYRAGSLFCRVLGPLQNRTLELIQQKRFLSQQVKAMGGVYDDVADLAAAVTCTYTTTRKHNRGLQPVTLRSAVIAVMACNRFAWFVRTGARSLGVPTPMQSSSSSSRQRAHSDEGSVFVGVAGSSRRSDIPTESWRREYGRYLFLAPELSLDDSGDAMKRVLECLPPSSTAYSSNIAAEFMNALSCFDPMHAVQLSRANSNQSTLHTLFRGLRAHYTGKQGSGHRMVSAIRSAIAELFQRCKSAEALNVSASKATYDLQAAQTTITSLQELVTFLEQRIVNIQNEQTQSVSQDRLDNVKDDLSQSQAVIEQLRAELKSSMQQRDNLLDVKERLEIELSEAMAANAQYATLARTVSAKYDALAAQLSATTSPLPQHRHRDGDIDGDGDGDGVNASGNAHDMSLPKRHEVPSPLIRSSPVNVPQSRDYGDGDDGGMPVYSHFRMPVRSGGMSSATTTTTTTQALSSSMLKSKTQQSPLRKGQ